MNVKCEKCKGETHIERGTYRYAESGLDNVYLENVEMRVCESCGERTPRIRRMSELHAVIGAAVALKKTPLTGAEVRYLRKHLGLKGKDWAAMLHVDVATLSRWESGEQRIGEQSDALIRAIYFLALADRQGIEIPKRVTEGIAAVVANMDEEPNVFIDPTKKPPFVYRLQSETQSCV